MNYQSYAFPLLYGVLRPYLAAPIANNLGGMVDKSAVTLVVNAGAVMLGKADAYIGKVADFFRAFYPFRCPTF